MTWTIEHLEQRVRRLEQRVYAGEESETEYCGSATRTYDVRRVSMQALRYTSQNWTAIEEFFGDVAWCREMTAARVPSGRLCIVGNGETDDVLVAPGDWLLKDAQGRIFPLHHRAFTQLYQERDAA